MTIPARRSSDHPRPPSPAAAATASELRALATDVMRIHDPLRANPELVLIAKNEIASRLRQLANAIEA